MYTHKYIHLDDSQLQMYDKNPLYSPFSNTDSPPWIRIVNLNQSRGAAWFVCKDKDPVLLPSGSNSKLNGESTSLSVASILCMYVLSACYLWMVLKTSISFSLDFGFEKKRHLSFKPYKAYRRETDEIIDGIYFI